MSSRLCVLVLAAVASFSLFAETADDAIQLSQNGVSTDVINAWAQRQNSQSLSAQDILRMRDAKVPDIVISTLIQNSRSGSVAPNNYVSETVPASSTTVYSTTPSYSTEYYSSTPYYSYDSYGYPYYNRGYYGYGSGIGLSFNFGGGHRGYRGDGGYGYNGYSGYNSYGGRGGYSSGYSGGYSSSGRSGYSGGYSSGGRSGSSSGGHHH